MVEIEKGQVLYIVSATLAGRCKVKRYRNYPEEDEDSNGMTNTVPGCYVATYGRDDTGDFQLLAATVNPSGRTEAAGCIAHVGIDSIHCGDRPTNFDFRQDLRLCLSPGRQGGAVCLSARGSGDWHVMYWIGDPEAIPQISLAGGGQRPDKKFRSTNDGGGGNDEDSSTLSMALLLGLMGNAL